MRTIAIAAATLLAAGTAVAQTPPPAEAPVNAPPTAAAAPAKEASTGFTLKSGADSLTIYGLIDATISNISNADAAGKSRTNYQTAWFSGNRYGLTGKHVLGEGSNIIYKLEGEFVVATGAMDTPGVIFNRDAWIGFEGDTIGQLTFGRQNTLARDFAQNFGDAYGSTGVRMDEGGWTNTNNFKQMIYYAAGVNGGTRYDQGIVWKKKLPADFMVGLGYQFDNDMQSTTSTNFSKNSSGSVGVAWNGGMINWSGFFTAANVNNLLHVSSAIGGNVTPIAWLRINAGYFYYGAKQNPVAALPNRKDNAFTVSAKLMPDVAYDFELGYQVMKTDNAATSGGNVINAFKDGSAATVVATGSRSTLYGSAFYHLDKRAEVYLAGDYLSLKDGYKVGATNGKTSQTELAVGMRFKF
jgi:predicted porin